MCGGLLADVVCRHGHTLAAQGRVTGCCVEGFWTTWFVLPPPFGKVRTGLFFELVGFFFGTGLKKPSKPDTLVGIL